MKINIFYQTDIPQHLHRTGLFQAACLRALKNFQREKAEVNVIFVDEKEILRVNKTYLDHHYVTDVISFNHARPPFDVGEPWAFGDVYVCYPVARQNAPKFKHTILQEMMMYGVHGCLHLSGMDDHAPEDRAEMDRQAEKIIKAVLKK
ncbi:MAG: rRNA maturation RNase YbeY [Elusimicrobiaceae bacterium]|nr:rRNA maturation RNase YbeY [Elusimicrobiaceae bacterium]